LHESEQLANGSSDCMLGLAMRKLAPATGLIEPR
jgi:hypothetical protein